MKIKLSKSQWELVGRKAGWMKKSQINEGAKSHIEKAKQLSTQAEIIEGNWENIGGNGMRKFNRVKIGDIILEGLIREIRGRKRKNPIQTYFNNDFVDGENIEWLILQNLRVGFIK